MVDVGRRFAQFRKRLGYSQKEAADLIGVNVNQIGNYETNRSEPSIAVLKKMAYVYHTTIDNLVGRHLDKYVEQAEKMFPNEKLYTYDEIRKMLDEAFKRYEEKYKDKE